ncbi:hypothetical protein BV898_14479 [Hypsibius exemplaris]|uniref:Cytochrome b-c1 complex subunit 10 n=1 Tax=Hypsibius exemplaris TaxID=2072580 RepID=A0A9X6N9I8_HYPEX|nr:hypothetical protein BV898_14479 [Hypsibius exemplaris]
MCNAQCALGKLHKKARGSFSDIFFAGFLSHCSKMTNPLVARYVGKRYIELAKIWRPTLVTYGTTAALLGLLFTDWKVTNRFIPFYRKKFDEVIDP